MGSGGLSRVQSTQCSYFSFFFESCFSLAFGFALEDWTDVGPNIGLRLFARRRVRRTIECSIDVKRSTELFAALTATARGSKGSERCAGLRKTPSSCPLPLPPPSLPISPFFPLSLLSLLSQSPQPRLLRNPRLPSSEPHSPMSRSSSGWTRVPSPPLRSPSPLGRFDDGVSSLHWTRRAAGVVVVNPLSLEVNHGKPVNALARSASCPPVSPPRVQSPVCSKLCD